MIKFTFKVVLTVVILIIITLFLIVYFHFKKIEKEENNYTIKTIGN
jgi:cell division protein FtsN